MCMSAGDVNVRILFTKPENLGEKHKFLFIK